MASILSQFLKGQRKEKSTKTLLILAILLTYSIPALANGGFYWHESIPLDIPYQRALLMFTGDQETLILQSKYRSTGAIVDDFAGWVVPVPSVPELASVDPSSAQVFFHHLDKISRPNTIRISDFVSVASLLSLPAGLLMLFASLLSFFVPRMQLVRRYRLRISLMGLVFVLFFVLVFPFFFLAFAGYPEGVDIIKEEQVGIYNVQVVKSHKSEDLIQWLNQNQFHFDDKDVQVFDEYLRQGWSFVVAKIDPSTAKDERWAMFEGLVAPLIMRFQTEAPVYPLALTSLSGHDTQVLLYVLSQSKWTNDGRLDLHYADEQDTHLLEKLARDVEPEGFFSETELTLPFLCKFKGTLTPEQMQKDLRFTVVEDDHAYRKWMITW